MDQKTPSVTLQCNLVIPSHCCPHGPTQCCLAGLSTTNDPYTLQLVDRPRRVIKHQAEEPVLEEENLHNTTDGQYWIPGNPWYVKYHVSGCTIFSKDTQRQLYSLWQENNEIGCASKINRTAQTCHNTAIRRKDRANGWSLHCPQHHRNNKRKNITQTEPLNVRSFLEGINYPVDLNVLNRTVLQNKDGNVRGGLTAIKPIHKAAPIVDLHARQNHALTVNCNLVQPSDYISKCPGLSGKLTPCRLSWSSVTTVLSPDVDRADTKIYVLLAYAKKYACQVPYIQIANLDVMNVMVPPHGYTLGVFLAISNQVRATLVSQRNALLVPGAEWTEEDKRYVHRVWQQEEAKQKTPSLSIPKKESALWMRYLGNKTSFPLVCKTMLFVPNKPNTQCVPSDLLVLANIVAVRYLIGYLYEVQLINIQGPTMSKSKQAPQVKGLSLLHILHDWIAKQYDVCLLSDQQPTKRDIQQAFHATDPLGFQTIDYLTCILTLEPDKYPWRIWTTKAQHDNPALFQWLSNSKKSPITLWTTPPCVVGP
jgi:hypothetical protein